MAVIRIEDGNSNTEIPNHFSCALTPFLGVSYLEKLFSPVYITWHFPLQLQMLVTQKKISHIAFQGNTIQKRVWGRGTTTESWCWSTWSEGLCPLETRSPLPALRLLTENGELQKLENGANAPWVPRSTERYQFQMSSCQMSSLWSPAVLPSHILYDTAIFFP